MVNFKSFKKREFQIKGEIQVAVTHSQAFKGMRGKERKGPQKTNVEEEDK